jgi:hypothetical protein
VRALYISGIWSDGNSMSTTGPITRATRPTPGVPDLVGVPSTVVAVMSCLASLDRSGLRRGLGRAVLLPGWGQEASASAPDTISLISWVISDCRAWFASLVYRRMRSSALSVAVCMARCRAASSDAAACSMQE